MKETFIPQNPEAFEKIHGRVLIPKRGKTITL
jgi:hypothetical protein